jgi:nitrate/TMAO reductase-like tetraheme cytochrome c subunit
MTEPLKHDWMSSEFSKLQSIKEHFPKEQKSTSAPERSQEKKLELSKKHKWNEAPVNSEC